MSTPDSATGPGDAGWGFILLSAAALLLVTLSAYTWVFGVGVWLVALWLDVALTAVAATLIWVRGGFGCLEQLVPFVATIAVTACTFARPDVVGPWIPAAQAIAVAAVVVGTRVRSGRRETGRN
ncbi:hypothetical protein GCM10009623_12400 [Nocardioides aestuarii]|uniref:Uncharacterized protein n=1 Tax=Nocardioides aestuarii TaxID=252231 RepID=A0ABW4TIB7_9ACTN